ncbi:SH3 domain-binding glutamic acid-rich protein homolog isoform X2 [Orussus abietinus]|uniref:SH3 domain-binding glutamic acid-rich protein homolog isoform X2 n=1 Tax=Orussus abietinus TaxID=222816 RepID=UPI000625A8FA|nr:SH3 domain-binding glutamic acid-rich protein homolog isoform X2 [Orussus abietinus]
MNHEKKSVKKRQQRVLMILESKNIEYTTIDITEPGREADKEFMQTKGTVRDSKYPLPPQIFNEDEYCGDYEDFDLANEIDELEKFLKVTPAVSTAEITFENKSESEDIQQNGNTSSREPSSDKDAATTQGESIDERTSLADKGDNSESRNSMEHESESKDRSETGSEQMEDSGDKNEEKSDDQEKEE